MITRILPFLNIWDNADKVMLSKLRAEFAAHLFMHAFIPLFGYFLFGRSGFFMGIGLSFIFGTYLELFNDKHLIMLIEHRDPDINDFFTDLFSRLVMLPVLLVIYWIIK